jgi:hypothetical protein
MTPSAPSAPRLALTLAAILGGAAPALSGTVATAPSYAPFTHQNECWLSNPGPTPVKVEALELVTLIGTVAASDTDFTVAPNTIHIMQQAGFGITYCRATGVATRKVRLTQCVRVNTGSPCLSANNAP